MGGPVIHQSHSRPTATPPPLILGDLIRLPMPPSTRGALLRSVPPLPTQPIRTSWVSAARPDQLPAGTILLSWEARADGSMDVTARLNLVATEVLLATWTGLDGDWTSVVHPTMYEVIGLHAALSVAIDALHLANHLAAA
jgi:hypothetical protein